MKKTFPVSWDQLHIDSRTLAQQLKWNTWNGIVAITRGGLIPASIIATELDIRIIETICISSYVPAKYEMMEEQSELEILKGDLDIVDHGKNWLLIDDLVDTGNTAQVARKLLPKAYFATLYAKPDGITSVDSFITKVSQDTWIIFPWDSP